MGFSVHLHLFYNLVIQTICTHKFKKNPAKLIAIVNANVFIYDAQLKTAATRNNYRKNDEKYARAVRVAIEFGWARLLVLVTGTLPGTRFTKMFTI